MTLIDRLSKLEGPDFGVNAEIAEMFGYPLHETPNFTVSLDAAIALAERLFPGTEYEFTNLYNIVRVTIEMNGEYGGFHGEHVNSLPIAICIALLRAKEASK